MREAINDFLFGTVKKNAEREYLNYDPEEGTREKSIGDRFGDWVTGRGTAIDEKVKDIHKANLKEEYGESIKLINENTPHTADITIDENTNPKVLAEQVKIGEAKATAYKNAKTLAVTNNISIPEGMTDPDAITQHVVKKTTERAEGKLKDERTRNEKEIRRLEARQDLQRLENQKMQLKRDADSKDLQIMQMMRQDKRSAKERKDRMFMQLMAGLQTLGQGFTI